MRNLESCNLSAKWQEIKSNQSLSKFRCKEKLWVKWIKTCIWSLIELNGTRYKVCFNFYWKKVCWGRRGQTSYFWCILHPSKFTSNFSFEMQTLVATPVSSSRSSLRFDWRWLVRQSNFSRFTSLYHCSVVIVIWYIIALNHYNTINAFHAAHTTHATNKDIQQTDNQCNWDKKSLHNEVHTTWKPFETYERFVMCFLLF